MDWGDLTLADGRIDFTAQPDTTGAKAWLNGSDLYRDFHMRLRLRIASGQFGIFCRATPDGESHIYFALGDNGDVWLRQKHAGMQPFTLASGRYMADRNGEISLEIFLRDRLFHAAVNGRPVFDEIASIRGELRPGMVGFSVWYPSPDTAQAAIVSLDLKPLTTAFLTWNSVESTSPALSSWLGYNAFRFTHLAPPWQRLAARGQSEQFGWDAEFFKTLARIYRMQLLPEVIIENMDTSIGNLSDRLAQAATAIPAQGILSDFSQIEGTHSPARITAWLQSLSRSMKNHDLDMVACLPQFLKTAPALASLFQGMTNLVVAMDQVAAEELRRDNHVRQIADIHYAALTNNSNDLVVHQLTGPVTPLMALPDEASAAILRTDGHAAFRAGSFERAVEIWKHWSDLDPQNSEPLSLIGDVYQRMGLIDQSVDHYLASLERNPGQIDLLVRCVRLMSRETRRTDEAQSLLELYERLFPDNHDIVLAQAELLLQQKRPDAAAAKIRRIIETYPDDLEARAILHGLLPESRDRAANLNSMLEIGTRPGREKQMVQTIHRWNLLRWPESWRLMEFLERMQELAINPDEKNILNNLLPRTTIVREDFHAGRISDNWLVSGDPEDQHDDTPFLGTDLTQTEAVLQLHGSDTMTSGFIDTLVEDVRGFFWLYARRSESSMIRFGFEQAGKLYLQIWKDGAVSVNQNRVWVRPDGAFRIRLEIRGDGAAGYINGQPAFGAPIPIPHDMGLGWWGIAPWAPKFGVAQALLREINGGPLPVRLGIFAPR
ncbi:MAG: hypothetical protein LC725_00450, partial [Lentisphaerae bacterium]|nr:hypothetical protein [Lentisphaerota bacterium]